MSDQTNEPTNDRTDEEVDELAQWRERAEAAESALAEWRARFAEAVAAVRDAHRAANPTIPPALIDGDTPEAIAASVEKARAIADQVLELAKANGHHAPHVPTGAHPSPSVDLSTMSPAEKIRYGLTQRRSRS